MTYQLDLITAIAERIHTAGIATWNPSAPYPAGVHGVYVDELPPTHDRAIAISLYPVDDDTGTTDTVQGVQLRLRGRPNNRVDVKQTGDQLFDAFHDLVRETWSGIPIVRVWRQSAARLGADQNGRQEETHNYYIQLSRPGTHRTDL